MPDTKTLERARADLTGPNAQLMHTVSSVLLEDLTRRYPPLADNPVVVDRFGGPPVG